VQAEHDYTYNVVHALIAQGVDFDIIGLFYCSTWHGSIETMQANLVDLAERYGKPIVIAETAYPWTLEWDDWANNNIGVKSKLLPGYSASVTGHRYLTSREAGAYCVPLGWGVVSSNRNAPGSPPPNATKMSCQGKIRRCSISSILRLAARCFYTRELCDLHTADHSLSRGIH